MNNYNLNLETHLHFQSAENNAFSLHICEKVEALLVHVHFTDIRVFHVSQIFKYTLYVMNSVSQNHFITSVITLQE